MIAKPFLFHLRRFVALPGLLMATLFLVACGSNLPSVPQTERFDPTDYNYVIGPGDNIEIFVWGQPELTGSSVVRPDGKVTTRLVEDMQASGRTPTQLAREIEETYSLYVRDPIVSVIVRGFVGVPEQQVSVIGEATEPRTVPYSQYMTLLDLMVAVGGMTEFAAGNRSVLVRVENGQYRSYSLRLDDLLRDGDISANMALRPGDIVIITESWF